MQNTWFKCGKIAQNAEGLAGNVNAFTTANKQSGTAKSSTAKKESNNAMKELSTFNRVLRV